jgi:hypothetical protein
MLRGDLLTALQVARATVPVAVVSAAVALVANLATHSTGPFALLAVGGCALVVRGVMALTNYRGVLDALAERERSKWWARLGFPHEKRAGAAAAVFIGAVWILVAVSAFITLFS